MLKYKCIALLSHQFRFLGELVQCMHFYTKYKFHVNAKFNTARAEQKSIHNKKEISRELI
jgi:hypoxanthine-guanine phosphoribosyltransferase